MEESGRGRIHQAQNDTGQAVLRRLEAEPVVASPSQRQQKYEAMREELITGAVILAFGVILFGLIIAVQLLF
jgi:hypothetical protein